MNVKSIQITHNQQGFTLVELVFTIGIIGMLMTLATLGFNQMQTKGKVEAQVRQMVADINEVRVKALSTNKRHSLTINADSYVFKSYSTDTFTSATDLVKGTIIPGGTHTVMFPMRSKTSPYAGSIYEFDSRGMLVANGATVFFTGNNVSSAALNCLTLHTVRVNAGKENSSGDCDDR
jgi:prepilin-type N-terminal cleavage/methylation domain-containing protein